MPTHKTLYCGGIHRLIDGAPVAHPCRVLSPEFLEAERAADLDRALEVLERLPIVLHPGIDDGDDVLRDVA